MFYMNSLCSILPAVGLHAKADVVFQDRGNNEPLSKLDIDLADALSLLHAH